MAPKAATKRGRPFKDAPRAKAAKIEVPKADPMLEGIFDAVKQADLPQQCKQLLTAVVPGSLGVPSNERHESQVAVVDMISRMMEDIKAKMTADIEEQKGLMATADSKKESLAGTVAEVQSRKDAAAALKLEKAQLLEAANKVVQEKLTLLEAAKKKQVEGDQVLAPVQIDKEKLEAAVDAEFKFLLEAEDREQEEVTKQYDAVKPLIEKLGLDESLGVSVFPAIEKVPSARGPFDNMVVEQLKQHLTDKIAKLEEELQAGAPAKAERAEEVQAAQGEVDKSQAEQAEAASEHTAADDALAAVVAELQTAQAGVTNFEREHKKATEASDMKVAVLQQFESFNVECFTTLKNKGEPKEIVMVEEDAEKARVEEAGA